MAHARIAKNPVGTFHNLIHLSGNVEKVTTYKVIAATGLNGHVPNGEQLIFLRINEKVGYSAGTFVVLPLDAFIQHFDPAHEEDVFWHYRKQVEEQWVKLSRF